MAFIAQRIFSNIKSEPKSGINKFNTSIEFDDSAKYYETPLCKAAIAHMSKFLDAQLEKQATQFIDSLNLEGFKKILNEDQPAILLSYKNWTCALTVKNNNYQIYQLNYPEDIYEFSSAKKAFHWFFDDEFDDELEVNPQYLPEDKFAVEGLKETFLSLEKEPLLNSKTIMDSIPKKLQPYEFILALKFGKDTMEDKITTIKNHFDNRDFPSIRLFMLKAIYNTGDYNPIVFTPFKITTN